MDNNDKLLFWRVLVATTHLDGIVSNDEIRFFKERLEHVDLTPAEREIIMADFEHEQDAKALFHELSSPAAKAECLSMMKAIFHADEEFHPLEQAFYADLNEGHHGDIDVEKMVAQVSADIDAQHSLDDKNPTKVNSAINWIVNKIYNITG